MANSREINSSILKRIIKKVFLHFGYEIKRKNNFIDRYHDYIAELTKEEYEEIDKFEKICLSSKLNLWSILQSIKYINYNKIPGDIVECGIYNGNTLSLLGKLLNKYQLDKKIWGYDTFEKGFLKDRYSDFDVDFKNKKITLENDNTTYFTVSEVISNINQHDKFDEKKYQLIKGDIIETLDDEKNIPEKISFLRMDTDIYKTTKKQLEKLYPKLSIGGILHIDDYGICPGVKKAVDEYFLNQNVWLHRVDFTCRYMIKENQKN